MSPASSTARVLRVERRVLTKKEAQARMDAIRSSRTWAEADAKVQADGHEAPGIQALMKWAQRNRVSLGGTEEMAVAVLAAQAEEFVHLAIGLAKDPTVRTLLETAKDFSNSMKDKEDVDRLVAAAEAYANHIRAGGNSK